jgi:hypothetical protein
MLKNRPVQRKSLVSEEAVKARAWVSSKIGQKAIREALGRAQVSTEQMAAARLVSQESLNEPITR